MSWEEEWEYYCTIPECQIKNRCYHQGKPTLCGQEKRLKKPPCTYCNGKGWFVNEDHPKYPEVQRKLDCWHCKEP